MGISARIGRYASLVRLSHTVFAMPFAVMGAILAADGVPDFRTWGLILVSMVSARTASMAMNRLADRRIDAENPRTADRELPAGTVSRGEVISLLVVSCMVFVAACAFLNRLVLALSPVALLVVLSYPFAKRFTSMCHLWLGAALGLSPVGAFAAVRGDFGDGFLPALLLGVAVLFWVSGFDVIYALLDLEFDRGTGIFSMPARLGPAPALAVSAIFHVITVALLAGVGVLAGLSYVYFGGLLVVALLLLYEHWIVRPHDLSRVNAAFFTLNGAVSLLLMVSLGLDVAMR
jgi:4-hydroxybenzoate polyprenyltransferase